jgi:hypothetical protein
MEDLLAITGQDVPLTEEADIMDRKKWPNTHLQSKNTYQDNSGYDFLPGIPIYIYILDDNCDGIWIM